MADELFTSEQFVKLLDSLYEQSINGIKGLNEVIPPVYSLAEEYRKKYSDIGEAARAMHDAQIIKCTASGVIMGLGGALTLPVALPANLGGVMFMQMRMIAATALMGGFDLESPQVKTFIYACLGGVSLGSYLKENGIEYKKSSLKSVGRISGDVLMLINREIGYQFVKRLGTRGVANMLKLFPVVGAVVSGGMDFSETRDIASRAYRMFIKDDFSAGEDIGEIKEKSKYRPWI